MKTMEDSRMQENGPSVAVVKLNSAPEPFCAGCVECGATDRRLFGGMCAKCILFLADRLNPTRWDK